MDSEMRILVLDDEEDFARGLSRVLQTAFSSHACSYVTSTEECLQVLRNQETAVLLTDLRMPERDGLEVLARALELQPTINVIVLTAYGSIERAVEALKTGAYDFLTKPLDHDHLFCQVHKALERYGLLLENQRLRLQAGDFQQEETIVGESLAARRLKETLSTVAQNDYTVLIQGESGTGKELAAKIIHDLSPRQKAPLITVNCPAIPDSLLESELFGHVKGAFTGAERDSKGLFRSADKGTILLDEIGAISPGIQTKLLRVLQEQEVRPVGSSESHRVDVRILAATNQDLKSKIKAGLFREDLYYRLNVLYLHLPTLQSRRDDIPLLTSTFLNLVCREMNIETKTITPEALSFLAARDWPGNVRELLNFIRRLVVFCPGEEIGLNQVRFLENNLGLQWNPEEHIVPYKEAKAMLIDDFTKTYVQDLLQKTQGNVSEAARLSGLERVSLQKILKRLQIASEDFR